MKRTKRSMSHKLVMSKVAIGNAQKDVQLSESLKELGFDEAKLAMGQEIYNRAEFLFQEQKRKYADQYAATQEVKSAWLEAREELKKYVTAARMLLLNESSLSKSLGLTRGERVSISSWITRARLFYNTALGDPDVLSQLQGFAVTREKLEAGLALVDHLEEIYSMQKIKKSEAQQATRDQEAAFAGLDRFMSQLRKVARVLLGDKPEYLEKLGFLERSTPIRKEDEEESEAPVAEVEENLEPAA